MIRWNLIIPTGAWSKLMLSYGYLPLHFLHFKFPNCCLAAAFPLGCAELPSDLYKATVKLLCGSNSGFTESILHGQLRSGGMQAVLPFTYACDPSPLGQLTCIGSSWASLGQETSANQSTPQNHGKIFRKTVSHVRAYIYIQFYFFNACWLVYIFCIFKDSSIWLKKTFLFYLYIFAWSNLTAGKLPYF